jgi:hypothetical protein
MPPGTVAAEHHQASDKAPKKLKRMDGGEKRKAEGLNVGARSIVEAQANKGSRRRNSWLRRGRNGERRAEDERRSRERKELQERKWTAEEAEGRARVDDPSSPPCTDADADADADDPHPRYPPLRYFLMYLVMEHDIFVFLRPFQ